MKLVPEQPDCRATCVRRSLGGNLKKTQFWIPSPDSPTVQTTRLRSPSTSTSPPRHSRPYRSHILSTQDSEIRWKIIESTGRHWLCDALVHMSEIAGSSDRTGGSLRDLLRVCDTLFFCAGFAQRFSWLGPHSSLSMKSLCHGSSREKRFRTEDDVGS